MDMAEKKRWWQSNRKIAENYVRDAERLIGGGNNTHIAAAIVILDSALSLCPRFHLAMELKARSLLHLRRYKQIADMLQDYIPSSAARIEVHDSTSLSGDEQAMLKKKTPHHMNCFPISDLKKKVMATLSKTSGMEQQQWRYSVLGQACFHLGLLEDALFLLQTGKRIAVAASRRKSVSWTEDSFSRENLSSGKTESESITQLITRIKFLIRRRGTAVAALDAGQYSEAVRRFTKLVEGRGLSPQGFVAECYMNRASAYQSLGRIADAIADCNRTLALEPSCVEALSTRASLFETIQCLTDSLHDLEHMKLLYNSILRDPRLLGPAWNTKSVHYSHIPGKLCSLTTKIQQLKQRVASGETGNVDYYALMGLRRGISRRPDLERAHLLLSLRLNPDKAIGFIERVELAEEEEKEGMESVRDRAKISALWLHRLILKGHNSVMAAMLKEEEEEEKARESKRRVLAKSCPPAPPPPVVFRGVFCRDLAEVANLLCKKGLNSTIPVKYEALRC